MNEELVSKLLYLKNGSGIHIKKKNRGKFTDYCGGKVTSECIARGKASPNPAIRKRATFAANARKWKHQDGGTMETDPDIHYAKEWMVDWVNKRRGLLDKNVEQLKSQIPENDRAAQYLDSNTIFNNQLTRARDANVKYVPNLKGQYDRDVVGLTLDSWNLDKLSDASNMVYHNRLANIPNISINESGDYSMGTIVHELTHGLGATPQEAAIAKYMKDKTYISNPKSNGEESEEFYKYLDNPTEVYSRRNEVLHWYDKEPEYKYDKRDLEKMRKLIDDSNLKEGFLDRYDDNFLLYLMNDVADNGKSKRRLNLVKNGAVLKGQNGLGIQQYIDYSKMSPRKKALGYVDSELQKAGYKYYPRLAILSSIQRESEGNPLAENGRWQGLLQWDERRYRISQPDSASELHRQTNHLLDELKGSGWNGNSELQQEFINANNLDKANNAFIDGFVRPGNRQREKLIRKNIGLKGLVIKQNQYTPIDTSLPGIATKYQDGGSLVYGKANGLIYTPLNTQQAPELTFEKNYKFPIEPVDIVRPTQPIQTPAEKQEEVATPTVQQTVTTQPTVQTSTQTAQTPVQTSTAVQAWSDHDLEVLNKDGSNRDKQRVTSKYLQEQLGLTREQAAALVGIWQAESSFNLNAANQAEKSGKNKSVKSSQYGIGIGQWTHDRHDNFVNYINAHGGNYSLKNQLDFAIEEIKTKYPEFLSNLKSASNIKDATAYAYVQYVGANERNIKDTADLYARVNKTVNRYRQKHLELYGKATNGFEQRLKFANNSLNIS